MTADALAQLEVAEVPAETFNVYRCDLPEHTTAWVRFRTTGYPFKLRREFEEAKNDHEVLLLILPRVEAWSVCDAEGQPLPAPAECLAQPERLEMIEDALLYWLVRTFYNFWRVRLVAPRKN